MATLQRITLFAPAGNLATSDYLFVYVNALYPLRDAFRALGVQAEVCLVPLNGADLKAYLAKEKPDAILDINRSRAQIDGLPDDVLHIAWVQDPRNFDNTMVHQGFGGSDQVYFFLPPQVFGFDPDGAAVKGWRYLTPGVDEAVFFPRAAEAESDFAFIGYLPMMMPDRLRNRRISDGAKSFTLGEIERELSERDIRTSNTGHAALKRFMVDFIRSKLDRPVISAEDFDGLLRIFEDGVLRITERRAMLEAALEVSSSLRIFGPRSWEHWPQFAPLHRGLLTLPEDLAAVYRTTRVGLHNGALNMHFRTMEAMACGLPLLMVPTPHDATPGGILSHFTEGQDFRMVTPDTVGEAARALLADEDARRAMGASASAKVLAGHTWGHRARQILDDVAGA